MAAETGETLGLWRVCFRHHCHCHGIRESSEFRRSLKRLAVYASRAIREVILQPQWRPHAIHAKAEKEIQKGGKNMGHFQVRRGSRGMISWF